MSKAGVKIERLMEENRELTSPVKKLISIFQGSPLPLFIFHYFLTPLFSEL